MQGRPRFTVIGPGGTSYLFRRTCGLPGVDCIVPRRIPASAPLDRLAGELGYIQRKRKIIWGRAAFDVHRGRWMFIERAALPVQVNDNAPNPWAFTLPRRAAEPVPARRPSEPTRGSDPASI